jgi:hypothetical protein
MASPDEQLLESIGLSPIATVISNPKRPDNPLEVANRGILRTDWLSRRGRSLAATAAFSPATLRNRGSPIEYAMRSARSDRCLWIFSTIDATGPNFAMEF